jgi:uncharacterized membrane protein
MTPQTPRGAAVFFAVLTVIGVVLAVATVVKSQWDLTVWAIVGTAAGGYMVFRALMATRG